MDHMEFIGLKAKINCANRYLEQVLTQRGKVDSYDVYKVVTRAMREHVVIVPAEQAKLDGLGIVRMKEEVA